MAVAVVILVGCSRVPGLRQGEGVLMLLGGRRAVAAQGQQPIRPVLTGQRRRLIARYLGDLLQGDLPAG